MGTDLKGKQLGVGINQRKDGLYQARFVNRRGKRRQKSFKKLQDCRQWLADSIFEDESSNANDLKNMTVDEWFKLWIDIKKEKIRENTFISYTNEYRHHIQPCIGTMLVVDVKAIHCQLVMTKMKDKGYMSSHITKVKALLHSLFDYACDNDIISSNPCKKSVDSKIGKNSLAKTALTKEYQKKFLEYAKDNSVHYPIYALALQTGLRIGELIGLKWSDINWKTKILSVQRNVYYSFYSQKWVIGSPKTVNGNRSIFLTNEAIRILELQKKKHTDVIEIEYRDFIFTRKGKPVKNDLLDYDLKRICKNINIPEISMHILRHTFATRCIEAGMRPKTLQVLLGHSNIQTTMNLYVHAMEDENVNELKRIADFLKIV